jgi:hypothetical protein
MDLLKLVSPQVSASYKNAVENRTRLLDSEARAIAESVNNGVYGHHRVTIAPVTPNTLGSVKVNDEVVVERRREALRELIEFKDPVGLSRFDKFKLFVSAFFDKRTISQIVSENMVRDVTTNTNPGIRPDVLVHIPDVDAQAVKDHVRPWDGSNAKLEREHMTAMKMSNDAHMAFKKFTREVEASNEVAPVGLGAMVNMAANEVSPYVRILDEAKTSGETFAGLVMQRAELAFSRGLITQGEFDIQRDIAVACKAKAKFDALPDEVKALYKEASHARALVGTQMRLLNHNSKYLSMYHQTQAIKAELKLMNERADAERASIKKALMDNRSKYVAYMTEVLGVTLESGDYSVEEKKVYKDFFENIKNLPILAALRDDELPSLEGQEAEWLDTEDVATIREAIAKERAFAQLLNKANGASVSVMVDDQFEDMNPESVLASAALEAKLKKFEHKMAKMVKAEVAKLPAYDDISRFTNIDMLTPEVDKGVLEGLKILPIDHATIAIQLLDPDRELVPVRGAPSEVTWDGGTMVIHKTEEELRLEAFAAKVLELGDVRHKDLEGFRREYVEEGYRDGITSTHELSKQEIGAEFKMYYQTYMKKKAVYEAYIASGGNDAHKTVEMLAGIYRAHGRMRAYLKHDYPKLGSEGFELVEAVAVGLRRGRLSADRLLDHMVLRGHFEQGHVPTAMVEPWHNMMGMVQEKIVASYGGGTIDAMTELGALENQRNQLIAAMRPIMAEYEAACVDDSQEMADLPREAYLGLMRLELGAMYAELVRLNAKFNVTADYVDGIATAWSQRASV